MHNQIFKLILLLHGQDRQSKALDSGSHHELLELVERLILTKTLFSPLITEELGFLVNL